MYKLTLTKKGTRSSRLSGETWKQACAAVRSATGDTFDGKTVESFIITGKPGDSLHRGDTSIEIDHIPDVRMLVVTLSVRSQEKALDTPTLTSMSFHVSNPASLYCLLDAKIAGFCDIPFNMKDIPEGRKHSLEYGTEDTDGEAVVVVDSMTGDELAVTSRWIEAN